MFDFSQFKKTNNLQLKSYITAKELKSKHHTMHPVKINHILTCKKSLYVIELKTELILKIQNLWCFLLS